MSLIDQIPSILEEIPNYIRIDQHVDHELPTLATHEGHIAEHHHATGCPVIPPISLSTTFYQEEPNQPVKYDYSRGGNYTRQCLEQCLASLEKGNHCMTFASGMAAIGAVTACLKTGDHILFFEDVYGGTNRYFRNIASNFGITCEPIDMRSEEGLLSALTNNTRMIWLETPSNPTMRLIDIEMVARTVKNYNPDILVVVDNTFLTPCYQLPLNFGTDIVIHSITKYLNGHSDVIMGAAICRRDDLAEKLRFQQFAAGAIASPFDSYLVLRSLRSLDVRMEKHQYNGLAVALYLERHIFVKKVLHPALKSHPQHELSLRQTRGSSGMVSFYIKGKEGTSTAFVKKLKVFILAESLGGFESLAEIPGLMTHLSVPPKERVALGISNDLIRLSVGLENAHDLLRDLDQAFVSVMKEQ